MTQSLTDKQAVQYAENVHRATLKAQSEFQCRSQLLHVFIVVVGLASIACSFMFVLEDSGKLYCGRNPYENTEDGLETCLAMCEKINGTDTGAKCTQIDDWGFSSYFAFAGLLALDTGHHLVSAFGDVWAPCTSRYFETSWPTYTFKTIVWVVTVAFGALSIAVYSYLIDTTYLLVVPIANGVYLLASLYLMSRDAKLRRAAAHMRAVVQVEHELLRIRQNKPHRLQNRQDIEMRNQVANRPQVDRRRTSNGSFASQFQRPQFNPNENADDRMSRIAKGASIPLNNQAKALSRMGAPSGFGDTNSALVRMGSVPSSPTQFTSPLNATRPSSPGSIDGYLAVGGASINGAAGGQLRAASIAGSAQPSRQASMPGFPSAPAQRMPTVASYQGTSSLAGY